jgi:hypothetical protein
VRLDGHRDLHLTKQRLHGLAGRALGHFDRDGLAVPLALPHLAEEAAGDVARLRDASKLAHATGTGAFSNSRPVSVFTGLARMEGLALPDGQLELGAELGRGSNGIVYEARLYGSAVVAKVRRPPDRRPPCVRAAATNSFGVRRGRALPAVLVSVRCRLV